MKKETDMIILDHALLSDTGAFYTQFLCDIPFVRERPNTDGRAASLPSDGRSEALATPAGGYAGLPSDPASWRLEIGLERQNR